MTLAAERSILGAEDPVPEAFDRDRPNEYDVDRVFRNREEIRDHFRQAHDQIVDRAGRENWGPDRTHTELNKLGEAERRAEERTPP